MKNAPTAISRMCRARALRRSAIGMGTRKSARVSPRSAAVVRSSRGIAIVIWTPVGGHTVVTDGPESSIALLEMDGPNDGQPARDAGGRGRREHRDAHAEDHHEADHPPRRPGPEVEPTTREDDHEATDR